MSAKHTTKKRPVADWHKADVIAELHKHGTTLRKLALERGCNARTFTKALRHPYPKAELLIASAIGVSPAQIWPSRYDPKNPTGARRLARLKDSRAQARRNVEPPYREAA